MHNTSADIHSSDHDLDPLPLGRALATSVPPASLASTWSINAAPGGGKLADISYGPGRALATGPSGPPIRPPSEAELAACASATNFNPYHDKRGRFTTSGEAGGKNDGPDGQGGGETKPASIASYQYPQDNKQNFARCTLYSLQTIIGVKTGKKPGEAEIEARFEAEAYKRGLKPGETIRWNEGPRLFSGTYAAVVSSVLKSYGVDSSSKTAYDSPRELAQAIIGARGEPAMLDIALMGHEGKEAHSVTVQWELSATDDSQGMFRVNNIASTGGSRLINREDFEKGKISADINQRNSAQSMRIKTFSVVSNYAVVIAKPR